MADKKTSKRPQAKNFDPSSVEPFKAFTVRVDNPEVLHFLAIAAARDAFLHGDAPSTGPEQALAELVTAAGRKSALWKYEATGGAKARPGSRIAYAPLDPTLAPERQAVKDAATFGVSILAAELGMDE